MILSKEQIPEPKAKDSEKSFDLDGEEFAAGHTRSAPSYWFRLFSVFCLFGMANPLLVLILVDNPSIVTIAFLALIATIPAAYFAANYITQPIRAVAIRLSAKSYGANADAEADADQLNPPAESSDSQSFRLKGLRRKEGSHYRQHLMMMPLPRELQAIEKMARAGRFSDIAMKSVTKDLFRHLSHQLKSPMALLRAHAQSAKQKIALNDLGATNDCVESISRVSMDVANLVEQLLSLAYVEGLEEGGITLKPVNLSQALTRMLRTRAVVGLDKEVEVKSAVEAGLWVLGESQLLVEMVACLVDNSIRYSPQGSVVKVEADRLSAVKTIRIRVTDEGPGVPEQERERVFEAFYGAVGVDQKGITTYGTRRHRAMKDGKGAVSHGLGLSLVRSIAKLHGANVQLEDGPDGLGLCVRILLSACDPPSLEVD
ncbi:hypothetical protein CBP36_19985 (plasmid) [Acidovorax carolinensis]|uniref:histidine kinase n=1 Tax=Acidovorax carolinensis TaxID=553814 RepID=A0A240UJP9_9BURK|nr:ATP-binding protein [Acidovorax carolinensis]ART57192.1 hypothetical protein CBP35_19960 [Acidovorax carolinensis]ART61249.1 hypothetical protein CBP36_19985 [Acidovorax carolinensis]